MGRVSSARAPGEIRKKKCETRELRSKRSRIVADSTQAQVEYRRRLDSGTSRVADSTQAQESTGSGNEVMPHDTEATERVAFWMEACHGAQDEQEQRRDQEEQSQDPQAQACGAHGINEGVNVCGTRSC